MKTAATQIEKQVEEGHLIIETETGMMDWTLYNEKERTKKEQIKQIVILSEEMQEFAANNLHHAYGLREQLAYGDITEEEFKNDICQKWVKILVNAEKNLRKVNNQKGGTITLEGINEY